MTEYGNGNITALFDGIPFDPNDHEPSKDFAVLPPGKYVCLIESAELKDTRDGCGKYVKVVLNVLEGAHAKRKLFDNINICNPSEDCQTMGIAQLSALGRAVNVFPVEDTSQLVDKVVTAVVKVKKRKDTGEDQNDVRTYEIPSAAPNQQVAPPGPGNGVAPVAQPAAPAPQTALNTGLSVSPNPVQPSYVPPSDGTSSFAPQADAPAGRSPWNR